MTEAFYSVALELFHHIIDIDISINIIGVETSQVVQIPKKNDQTNKVNIFLQGTGTLVIKWYTRRVLTLKIHGH